MPLAKDGGGVAALFDELRKGHFVAADSDFRAWSECAVNAESIWVAASEQAATGGRADRLRNVEVAEDAALRGESIKIGSDEPFRAEDTNVSVALVVGQNDDDIRQFRTGSEGRVDEQ